MRGFDSLLHLLLINQCPSGGMVYTHDLKSCAERHVGSSPTSGTMTIFYTRKGDSGSSIIGKKKIKKTNPFTETLGELDELNSMIGVLKADRISLRLEKILHQVQEDLFIIQANVAYVMLKEKRKPPVFLPAKIVWSEQIIDTIENKLKSPKGFVISGSTRNSAWLDMLRARSRKVERSVLKIVSLREISRREKNWELKIDGNIVPYLNRLSSLFFALARDESHRAGKKEQHPKYK